MRVAFNQFSTLRAKTGVGEYTRRLMDALRDDGVDVGGVPSGLLATLFRWSAAENDRATPATTATTDAPLPQRWHHARTWMRHLKSFGRRRIEAQARRVLKACDVYHEPNFLAMDSDAPTVVTIHDLSVVRMPEYHPVERVREYERDFERSLRQAAHVITVSKSIRQEVIELLGQPAHKVTAIHNGVRPELRPLPSDVTAARLRALQLPQQYLLCLGTLEPRKNVLQLMQVYCSLPENLRARCPLVLAGGWGWNYREIADYYQSHARHAHVRHLGYVNAEDLVCLYNGARALVSPSYYEGFGLPPAEMLACGGAVIASRIDAAVEVVGGQAHLIDPDDRDGWRQAMMRVIVDDDWRDQLRNGATDAVAGMTWRSCARETMAVYRQVIQPSAATSLVATPTKQAS